MDKQTRKHIYMCMHIYIHDYGYEYEYPQIVIAQIMTVLFLLFRCVRFARAYLCRSHPRHSRVGC